MLFLWLLLFVAGGCSGRAFQLTPAAVHCCNKGSENAVALTRLVVGTVSSSLSSREGLEGEHNFSILVQIYNRADSREKQQLCCALMSLVFVDSGHADIFLLFTRDLCRQKKLKINEFWISFLRVVCLVIFTSLPVLLFCCFK